MIRRSRHPVTELERFRRVRRYQSLRYALLMLLVMSGSLVVVALLLYLVYFFT